MGEPRVVRRKVVVLSDDDEDDTKSATVKGERDQPTRHGENGSDAPDADSPGKPVEARSAKRATRAAPTQRNGTSSPVKDWKKASKAKSPSNAAVREASRISGKPIYSFFNFATQRPSQPSASPERPLPKEQTDAIDDDDDDVSAALSKGSSTALTLRKRKNLVEAGYEANHDRLPRPMQKFRKTSDGTRTPSFSTHQESLKSWTEQYAPTDLSELAVHKRKVSDVRQWLELTFSGKRRKVLVLKGPAGAGKTATIELLAKDMGLHVSAWHNPLSADRVADDLTTSTLLFEDFVFRAGRSNTLMFESNMHAPPIEMKNNPHEKDTALHSKRILLIEEFPTSLSRASVALQNFRSTVLQFVSTPLAEGEIPTPLILIVSETLVSSNTAAADSFTAHRLLGPELMNHPYINIISFNPVAPTILVKALEAIVVKEARKSGRRKTPGPAVLDHLTETGDIRSAVAALEFLCLRGDEEDVWSSKVQFTRPKKKSTASMTKAEEEALKLIGNRESNLEIFHAVGRVVHNKRVAPSGDQQLAQPPSWLPQHRRAKIPERDVDTLIDEIGTDISTYVSALHENYAQSCPGHSNEETLDSLSGCAESLSDADLMSVDRFAFGSRAYSGSALDAIRQDEITFHTAVRGLLFHLPSPVHRVPPPKEMKGDAFRMRYPLSLRIWRVKEEVESDLEVANAWFHRNGDFHYQQSSGTPAPRITSGTVESWRQNKALTSSESSHSTEGEGEQSIPRLETDADMILFRLPYLVHILRARPTPATNGISDRLKNIVGFKDRTTALLDNDDVAEDDPPDEVNPAVGWDGERKGLIKAVHHRDEPTEAVQLVLPDDDIVDA